jgi:gamma-glutamyltranspeptidase/glutathione hydrolase
VVLHNRGLGFNMIDGHPNCIGAAKRPMHTIIPAIVTQAGETQSAFGVMGAHYQPMGQSYVLDSMRRYGLDPQTAIDLPRYFPNGNVVELETGISASLRTGLAALGHQLAILDKPHGGAQAIVIDRVHGVLAGGSDPRKDGCVIGY